MGVTIPDILDRVRSPQRLAGGVVLLVTLATPLWAGHAPTAGGPPPNNPPPPPPPGCGQNVCCPTGGGGLRVDYWNGRESLSHTDLVLPGLMPIEVRRSYDSQAQYDSALGYGWALNYFVRLYEFGDGSVILRRDCGVRRGFVLVGGAYQTPAGETGALVKNGDGSWTYTEKSGEQLRFDASGRLSAMVSAAGPYLQFTYDNRGKLPLIGLSPYAVDTTPKEIAKEHRLLRIAEFAAGGGTTGRFVDLAYDEATGRLTGLSDSAGRSVTYEHDGLGNLTQVSLPEGGELNYAYEDPRDPHNATTLTNSGCSSCGGFAYELTYDAQDRVIREQVGHHVMRMTYAQAYLRTIVDEDVADADGNPLYTATSTYEFNALGNPTKITDPFGHQRVLVYDGNMNLTREERWENTGTLVLRYVEERTYDARANVLTITEAKGSPQQRVTTHTYDASSRLSSITTASVVSPAQNKVTSFDYDTRGNLLTQTEAGLLGSGTPFSYTTTYTYDPNGRRTSLDGPRADVSDLTTYTYDASGNLASVSQPLSLTTTYANYTAIGRPQTVTDPNGVATTYTYDSLGRVKTMTVASHTTSYTYSPSGKLTSVVHPRGNTTAYTYDALDRLVTIRDGLGNSINYTYDSAGNRLREEVKDPAGITRKSQTFQYDLLNRLFRVVGPDNSFSEYAYDHAGNRKSARNPQGQLTTYSYDALDRLVTVTQPGSVVTTYGYDAHDNTVSVTNPEGQTTTSPHDDLGRIHRETSPDEGLSTYGYDAAGNRTLKTDARGVTVGYQFDALNRLLRIDFPADPDITYVYDTCPFGKGRLCQVQDHAGSQALAYDARGHLTQESRQVLGVSYNTAYGHDANGSLATLTYPSGRTVTYAYDAGDRVSGVTTTPPGGGAQTVASGVGFMPFGGVASLTFGNGLAHNVTYGQDYRPAGIQTPGVWALAYQHDPNGNVTAITDALAPSKNRSFGYDTRDRLTAASGPWGTLGWTYDKAGNRLTQTAPEGTSTYTYQSGSSRLASVSGSQALTFGLDARGNTTSENVRAYSYDQANRLVQAVGPGVLADYRHDAQGHRVVKTADGETTVFHHGAHGLLLAESSAAGIANVEYIYLGLEPIAQAQGTILRFLHVDHLGTPRVMTDAARTKVWEIETRPFGDGAVTIGNQSVNLRFPGQYLDAETGLHQNGFRDYHPALGRYIQADPLAELMRTGSHHQGARYHDPVQARSSIEKRGRRASILPRALALGVESDNPYEYVGSNPLRFVDPRGLSRTGWPKPPPCAVPCFPKLLECSFTYFGNCARLDEFGNVYMTRGCCQLKTVCTDGCKSITQWSIWCYEPEL